MQSSAVKLKSFRDPHTKLLIVPGALSTMVPGPRNKLRWTHHRKALVLMALQAKFFTESEALAQFDLTPVELVRWKSAMTEHGILGLKALSSLAAPSECAEIAGAAPVDPSMIALPAEAFEYGGLHFSPERQEVSCPKGVVRLTRTPWRFLMYLVAAKGEVCSKPLLYELIYKEPHTNQNFKVLDVFAWKVRSCLTLVTDDGPIETVWGRGWRFRRNVQA